MKIVIGHDAFYPNVDGASYFTQRLAIYLKKAGHEIFIIANSQTVRSHRDEYHGMPMLRLGSSTIFVNDYRLYIPTPLKTAKLKKAIKEFGPDMVHIQGNFPLDQAIFEAARDLGLPVVATNHAMPQNMSHYLPLPSGGKKLANKMFYYTMKRFYMKCDRLTTPTVTARSYLYDTGVTKEVLPISCGIDLEIFNFSGKYADLRKKYAIPAGKNILFVGRQDREKKVDVLIRAMELIVKAEPTANLVLVGKGEEKEDWEKLAADLGLSQRVIFTGFVPDEDLPGIYALADCFAIACPFELQSIVTMQAMAMKLPVVAVREMALPELVHHGENGYLFADDDYEAAAKYLIKLLADNEFRKKLAEKSLEIIQSHDIKNTIKRFEKVYEEAIEINKKRLVETAD
jgi:glycosyltransferase involved in cell wall biosynthesis